MNGFILVVDLEGRNELISIKGIDFIDEITEGTLIHWSNARSTFTCKTASTLEEIADAINNSGHKVSRVITRV